MYKLQYVVEWKRSYFLYNGYHWNYVLTCDIKKIEKIYTNEAGFNAIKHGTDLFL